MSKFKAGDEVISNASSGTRTTDKVYTVVSVDNEGDPRIICDDGRKRLFFARDFTLKIKKGETMKKILKQQAQKTYDFIKPYEKYIVVAAILIAMDYFIFKGQLSGKIKKLATKVFDKLMNILDKAIEKIGLGEENDEQK